MLCSDKHYLVVERGVHNLEDGTLIEAGLSTANHDWKNESFRAPFTSSPVVFSQAMSDNDSASVVTRQKGVSKYGVQIRLQEEESADGYHSIESLGWVAISVGGSSNKFEVGLTNDVVTQSGQEVDFKNTYNNIPVFISAMQTFDGPDTADIRLLDLTSQSARIFVEEEQSANVEIYHTTEVVGYFALNVGDLVTK